jgi:hypothetical protein
VARWPEAGTFSWVQFRYLQGQSHFKVECDRALGHLNWCSFAGCVPPQMLQTTMALGHEQCCTIWPRAQHRVHCWTRGSDWKRWACTCPPNMNKGPCVMAAVLEPSSSKKEKVMEAWRASASMSSLSHRGLAKSISPLQMML